MYLYTRRCEFAPNFCFEVSLPDKFQLIRYILSSADGTDDFVYHLMGNSFVGYKKP